MIMAQPLRRLRSLLEIRCHLIPLPFTPYPECKNSSIIQAEKTMKGEMPQVKINLEWSWGMHQERNKPHGGKTFSREFFSGEQESG